MTYQNDIYAVIGTTFGLVRKYFKSNFENMSATQRQMEILINFMEEHPDMAKNYIPKTTQGRQIKNQLWADLAGKLNAVGLPTKSVSAWRKVWIDFKYRAKRKCSQNLLSMKKTGGGPSDQVPISELEEKAIQMASLRSAVAGSSSNCYGAIEVHDTDPEDDNSDMDENEDELEKVLLIPRPEIPKKSVKELSELGKRKIQPHKSSSTPKKARENDPKLNLLRTQVEADNNFQSGVMELLEHRNNEEAKFHVQVIKLLEKRNEIAAKHLELTKQMHNNNN